MTGDITRDNSGFPKAKDVPALLAALGLLVFAAGEIRKFCGFAAALRAGSPYAYMYGSPHWIAMALLAPFMLRALFSFRRRGGKPGAKLSGAKLAAVLAGAVAGIAAVIALLPLLFGGGTVVAQEMAKSYGYEACFWRTGFASLRGRHFAWEAFYVPHGSDCLRLDNYQKEKRFGGIADQAGLPPKAAP